MVFRYDQNYNCDINDPIDVIEKKFHEAVARQPEKKAQYLLQLSSSYSIAGMWDKAVECCHQILEIATTVEDKTNGYSQLSSLYDDKKDYVTSIAYQKKLLEVAPDNADEVRRLGYIYLDSGDYDSAFETWSRLSTMRDRDGKIPEFDYHLCMGQVYYKKKNYAQALMHYEQAAKKDEEHPDPLSQMGFCYYFLKQPEKAIPYLNRFNEMCPDEEPSVYNLLGLCYAATGDSYLALHNLLKAAELNNEENRELAVRNYTAIGNTYYTMEQDTKNAITYLTKALNLNPDRELKKDIYIHLIKIYDDLKDFKERDRYGALTLLLDEFPPEPGSSSR